MSRSILRPTSPAEAVVRARSMIGFEPRRPPGAPPDWRPLRIHYRLDAASGGDDPRALHPAEWSYGLRTPTCDCVGFAAWALGFSRYHAEFQEYGGHINTTSMLLDARDDRSFFEPVEIPEPGDLIVYGGLYDERGDRVRPGHVGVIVGLPADWTPPAPWKRISVVHCSSGNQRRTGAAIGYGDGDLWRARGGSFLRYVRAVRACP